MKIRPLGRDCFRPFRTCHGRERGGNHLRIRPSSVTGLGRRIRRGLSVEGMLNVVPNGGAGRCMVMNTRFSRLNVSPTLSKSRVCGKTSSGTSNMSTMLRVTETFITAKGRPREGMVFTF